MSYRWRQETAPMTSLLVLQRALDQCGFQIIEAPAIMKHLALARKRVSHASTTHDKIAAYEELIDLIRQIDQTDSLPKSIKLDGVKLSLSNSFCYVAEGYSSNESTVAEMAAKSKITELNNVYKEIAAGLESELTQAMSSLESQLREALIKAVKAEQESYKKSITVARQEIFKIIRENAKKEGYSLKRHVFTAGKNAGREQYVVVKRV